jgi:hypothetical protein
LGVAAIFTTDFMDDLSAAGNLALVLGDDDLTVTGFMDGVGRLGFRSFIDLVIALLTILVFGSRVVDDDSTENFFIRSAALLVLATGNLDVLASFTLLIGLDSVDLSLTCDFRTTAFVLFLTGTSLLLSNCFPAGDCFLLNSPKSLFFTSETLFLEVLTGD